MSFSTALLAGSTHGALLESLHTCFMFRDCYESMILLTYLSPDLDQQNAIFRKAGLSRQADRDARRKGEKEAKWLFPLGFLKWKPEVSQSSPTFTAF